MKTTHNNLTAADPARIPYVLTGLMEVREVATGPAMSSPGLIFDEIKDMGDYSQESFLVITLNTKNKIINKNIISIGLLDSTSVHSREVFKCAIRDNAKSIILAHNHPSGDPSPSSPDIKLTKRLIDCGRLLDIPVLDHIIVGRDKYISLREDGIVDFC